LSTVAVAVSGGRDSTALLHCTLRMARPLGLRVLALHVHHGLLPEADAWQARVRRQARRWGAGFASCRLSGAPAAGESVEAWARAGRYDALGQMAAAAGAPIVLLAHHRRDQAETWLLQALRGGGPAGLAAMPRLAQRQGLVWARPWLDQPREAIEAYLRRHRLQAVDDPSNVDPRLARSRLRAQVWPALQAAFADAETALAQSSRRAHEAATLAQETAAVDLPACMADGALWLPAWQALPPARRTNALRHWLGASGHGVVPESLVQRLLHELPGARSARFPVAGGELQLYRSRLARVGSAAAAAAARGDAGPPVQTLDLSRPGQHRVAGWQGVIEIRPCLEGGVAPPLLQGVQARTRAGGEQFQRLPGTPPRSLKKQAQGLAVPAWQRQGPVLYTADGRLLFVPWLGLDARCLAPPGQPQFSLQWRLPTGLRQPSS
jgi:tRNA(Ile)-lysidine synthase